MKKVSLIGCTGSIGRQVIDVIGRYPDKFKITALVAGRDSEAFDRLAEQLKPEYRATASSGVIPEEAVAGCDIVFNAAGGFAGLGYSLAAIKAGKTLALANKETLVCGGDVVMPLAEKAGVDILPVDSEHSAIWQCLNFNGNAKFRRLIITASGGAFRDFTPEQLEGVTPEQALAHPTWKMGKKISVDSATLMNKGYEVIEAHILYKAPYRDIETVIQPQSVVHSLVEFTDGAVMAQMSYPTMELPIQLALSYPERLSLSVAPMDFGTVFSLDFKPLPDGKYPCFALALECGKAGGIMPCVLNAADEVAVSAFLQGEISFTDIYRVVDGVVQKTVNDKAESFGRLKQADEAARAAAREIIGRVASA